MPVRSPLLHAVLEDVADEVEVLLHGVTITDCDTVGSGMPRLTYYDFDKVERSLDLGAEPVLIGRATECQIRTEDAVVSRRHARIVLDGGEYWIEDLGSMSGVFVGTEKVQRAKLLPGAPAVMGSLVVYVMPEEAAPAAAGATMGWRRPSSSWRARRSSSSARSSTSCAAS